MMVDNALSYAGKQPVFKSIYSIVVGGVFYLKMLETKHSNLNSFIGACIAPPNLCVVWEYCSKGSLQDVIYNDAIQLDDMFKFSICIDMLKVSC